MSSSRAPAAAGRACIGFPVYYSCSWALGEAGNRHGEQLPHRAPLPGCSVCCAFLSLFGVVALALVVVLLFQFILFIVHSCLRSFIRPFIHCVDWRFRPRHGNACLRPVTCASASAGPPRSHAWRCRSAVACRPTRLSSPSRRSDFLLCGIVTKAVTKKIK